MLALPARGAVARRAVPAAVARLISCLPSAPSHAVAGDASPAVGAHASAARGAAAASATRRSPAKAGRAVADGAAALESKFSAAMGRSASAAAENDCANMADPGVAAAPRSGKKKRAPLGPAAGSGPAVPFLAG